MSVARHALDDGRGRVSPPLNAFDAPGQPAPEVIKNVGATPTRRVRKRETTVWRKRVAAPLEEVSLMDSLTPARYEIRHTSSVASRRDERRPTRPLPGGAAGPFDPPCRSRQRQFVDTTRAYGTLLRQTLRNERARMMFRRLPRPPRKPPAAYRRALSGDDYALAHASCEFNAASDLAHSIRKPLILTAGIRPYCNSPPPSTDQSPVR